MLRLLINLTLFLYLLFSSHQLKLNHRRKHRFYALEDAPIISLSESINILNNCKDKCLVMGKTFPFSFKYHRYILRQTTGTTKYVTGQCLFTAGEKYGDKSWHSWEDMRDFVSNTVEDVDIQELKIWQDFQISCEDKSLQLSQETLDAMNMTRVHSNFQYFDDGSFQNLEPFDDIDDLFDSVSGLI